MHVYPPIKPKQVHLRCVPLTSYRFLQTLPLASNALASRIIFPSVGAIQVSFNLTGLPASLGKQIKCRLRDTYSYLLCCHISRSF
ncbi:hypothetical protein BZG75_14685 [Salinivibrio sp. AR640]|nr:hypothetical protein BZG75_14685 [Salinivibrio sp. AR640]